MPGLLHEPTGHLAVAIAENFPKNRRRHARLAQAVHEPQAPLLELVAPNGHRGTEPTHPPHARVRRELPDAEESQDVVDSHRGEVPLEVRHPRAPPPVPVLAHLLPVVRGEAPVLTVRVEIVRGGARAGVHAEEVGVHPGVHARLVHADGQVALKDHAHALGVRSRRAELRVQVELDKVVQSDGIVNLAAGLRQARHRARAVVRSERAPPPVLSGAKEVAQGAEHGVGFEPSGVLGEKLAKLGRVEERGLDSLEAPPGDGHLYLHRRLVVNLLQIERRLGLVDLGLQAREPVGVLGPGDSRRLRHNLLDPQVQRVQRKDRHGRVRVRVPPHVVHRRVVHR